MGESRDEVRWFEDEPAAVGSMIEGLPLENQPTSCRRMVRFFVSAGIGLACSWSVLAGSVQAMVLIGNTDENSTNPPSNRAPVNQFLNNALPIHSPSDELAIIELKPLPIPSPGATPPPSLSPPKKQWRTRPLTVRRIGGSLVAAPRGAFIFYGLVANDSGGIGYVRLVLNRGGRGSASVSLNNKRSVIPVKVSESGEIAPVGNASSRDVSISGTLKNFSDGSIGFDAVLTRGGQQTSVRVLKATPPENFAKTVTGRYTLVFENNTSGVILSPGVTGIGTLRVNKSGTVVFAGRLSDGSNFSQGTQLNSAGNWALYAKSNTGAMLSGNVAFADLTDSDCSGALQWTRQVDGTIQSATPSLRGSRYTSAKTFGDGARWNFEARLNSGEIQAEALVAPALNNALILTSATADQTCLRLNRISGKLSGTFIQYGPVPQTATGIVFQKTNEGFGLTKQRASGASAWAGKFTLQATSSL